LLTRRAAEAKSVMLTNIRVKNFKSLKDVNLELGQRNVLVGANMAGKSNVIDFFKFIYDMTFPNSAGSALANAVFARGGFSELLWKGGEEQIVSISLSGKVWEDGRDWPWSYEIAIQGEARNNAFRIVHERFQRNPIPSDLIEVRGFQRFFRNVDGREISSMSEGMRSMLEFEIPDWHGNFLRSEIASWRFYELVPALMRNSNPTAATTFLMQHGENLSQWLLNIQTRYADCFGHIQGVLRDALPQIAGLFTFPTQQSTVFLGSREKYLLRPVTLAQMSSGELAFIAFLSLIFSPPEHTGGLYCIEEIENYLHPSLIETLLEILRQSQQEWEQKKQASQIIMTTHSPTVVDKMNLDEIIFVEKKGGLTLCSRPSGKPHLRELLQNEEIGLGDLVYSGALSDVGK
jgi:predicted ATPase